MRVCCILGLYSLAVTSEVAGGFVANNKSICRTMKISKFTILFLLLIIILPYTYGGCVVVFSSGNSENEEKIRDDESSSGFIGITSQASINSENAGRLAGGAIAGGLTSIESQSTKLMRRDVNYQIDAFRALRFPLVMGDSLRKIEISPSLIKFSRTNFINENGLIESDCGGVVSYRLSFNRDSERFTGSLLFEEYCDGGLTIDGQVDVDGTFDKGSGDFITANFSFYDLSDASHSLDGDLLIDYSDKPILVNFSAYCTDKHTGKTYWIKKYSLNIIEYIGHIEVEIFGTFYHPDYGYVSFKTSQPFILHDTDDWPASGQLVIEGDNDTIAQISAIDQFHCRIEANTNGAGIFDWDSEIIDWEDSPSAK